MYKLFTFAQIESGEVVRVFDVGVHPAHPNAEAVAIKQAKASGDVVQLNPGDDVLPGDLYKNKKFTRPAPPEPEPIPEPTEPEAE